MIQFITAPLYESCLPAVSRHSNLHERSPGAPKTLSPRSSQPTAVSMWVSLHDRTESCEDFQCYHRLKYSKMSRERTHHDWNVGDDVFKLFQQNTLQGKCRRFLSKPYTEYSLLLKENRRFPPGDLFATHGHSYELPPLELHLSFEY